MLSNIAYAMCDIINPTLITVKNMTWTDVALTWTYHIRRMQYSEHTAYRVCDFES